MKPKIWIGIAILLFLVTCGLIFYSENIRKSTTLLNNPNTIPDDSIINSNPNGIIAPSTNSLNTGKSLNDSNTSSNSAFPTNTIPDDSIINSNPNSNNTSSDGNLRPEQNSQYVLSFGSIGEQLRIKLLTPQFYLLMLLSFAIWYTFAVGIAHIFFESTEEATEAVLRGIWVSAISTTSIFQ